MRRGLGITFIILSTFLCCFSNECFHFHTALSNTNKQIYFKRIYLTDVSTKDHRGLKFGKMGSHSFIVISPRTTSTHVLVQNSDIALSFRKSLIVDQNTLVV